MPTTYAVEAYVAFVADPPSWAIERVCTWEDWTFEGAAAIRTIEAATGGYLFPGPKQHADDAIPRTNYIARDIVISDDWRCCGGCCE